MDAHWALIKLAFNEDGSVTKKVFSYTTFQFIVDIGSSVDRFISSRIVWSGDSLHQCFTIFETFWESQLSSSNVINFMYYLSMIINVYFMH